MHVRHKTDNIPTTASVRDESIFVEISIDVETDAGFIAAGRIEGRQANEGGHGHQHLFPMLKIAQPRRAPVLPKAFHQPLATVFKPHFYDESHFT